MTNRQQKILNVIVKEYVKNSKPVSSKMLVQEYKLGLSSATIRNEMKELEKQKYLKQPHTSAGRIPTEKGYRFFIGQPSEDVFGKCFNDLFKQAGKEETKVFIGKEIPLAQIRKFTLIVTSYRVSKRRQETIGFLGPTRMRYDYHISLINKLREMMENYE
jgi:transcriptional regulator of heat shock response